VAACKFRAYRSLAGEMVALAAPAFAAAVEAAGAEAAPAVTWVPGHRGHTLERGFNQAELLARGLAREAGLPAEPLLSRTRHGARQSGLGRAARAANVSGAFALREGSNGVLRMFKRVIIVDDVYTTGETLNQCSEVLALAGVRPHVFTFARTVRATAVPASPGNAVPKERCS
jgi:predicted amidophosphoribosyltransferase